MKKRSKVANLKIRKKDLLATALAGLLLITGAVGGTVAYLHANSGAVTNQFSPGSVQTEIKEEFEDKLVKENVRVKNEGSVPVYTRAEIVISWQKKLDNGTWISMNEIPSATDYSIEYGNGWKENSDGYYYYTSAIEAGDQSSPLINTAKQLVEGPDGSTLTIDILSQSIQAYPEDAVKDAWGVSIKDLAGTTENGGEANE